MNNAWVESSLRKMTIEEKVGQLLMVGLNNLNEETASEIIETIVKYNLGGIFHFSHKQSFISQFIEDTQKRVNIPVFVAGDYECGPGWVVDEGIRIPRAMCRGYLKNTEEEYELGKLIATQGRAMGVTLTFSPVVDLNTNHNNPDINIRAYGEDSETVSELSVPYIKGIQDNGMLACIKHFPGNGGTDMDPHISTAVIPFSREQMEKDCLAPYRKCFKDTEIAAVMLGHLEVPSMVTEVNPKNGRTVPTSLSYEIVTDLLRKEMGFKGLVITDALNMGGVLTHYTREEIAVKALLAGVDMLLIFNPEDFYLEYNAILEAVRSGVIEIEIIDKCVRNVLNAKTKVGLDIDNGMPALEEIREKLFIPGQYDDLFIRIIEKGITVLRNKDNILPVKNISGCKVAVISTYNPDEETYASQDQASLFLKDKTPEYLSKAGADVQSYHISNQMNCDEIYDVIISAGKCDYIFYNFFISPSWGIGSLIPNKSALRLFMFGLLSVGKPVIVTAFGSPYPIYYCPNAPVYMCTFDETLNAQKAAVKAWLGEINIIGRSPVSLDMIFSYGDGIDILNY
ncbi:MAG: putative lipoprotein YbbD precursor [Firmicutes bacterium ADurb.Bin419]|nr:MAG: putative lipoprotein YbbD precursor [Firmicutes bacterium ADurb.Bin419]